MNKFYLPVLFLLVYACAFPQTPVNKISPALEMKVANLQENDRTLIWVYFTDKGNNTDVYFSHPLSVVSEKSLKRREKVLGKTSPLTIKDIPVNPGYLSQVKAAGVDIKWPSKWLNAVSGTVSKSHLNEIASLPFVKKLDVVYKLKKGYQPETDKNQIRQSLEKTEQPEGVHSYDYGESYAQLQQINVPAVHDMGYTGQGVTVCLMDAGFSRLSHDAFLSMDIIAAWDFVNNDPNVGNEGDMGDGSHGTETLSTIGGYAPGYLIGPAFNSTYILAKTENTDSETPIEEDNWIAAMEWADSIGVDVTSTSLSYLDYDPPWPSYTWMDMDGNTTVITNGADYAVSIGIVVVNSAGNAGYNSTHNTLGAPADGDSVITAGAVNSSGTRSSFSSVGPTVDGRIKPDIMALGSGDVVASPYGDHSYTNSSGTSFSCPLSAGVAALILCANPNLTPMEVRDAMRNTASQSGSPDNLYGWGILNTLDAINYFPANTFQVSVDVANKWNLVSVPGINPDGMSVDNWWVNHSGSVFKFVPGTGYTEVTITSPGEGYYMYNNGSQVYNTGDEWPAGGIQLAEHNPISAIQVWNIIGVYEDTVDVTALTTTPPQQIVYPIYEYIPFTGYVTTTNLYPGYGYWVKVAGNCQINIPNVAANRNRKSEDFIRNEWGRIMLTDAAGNSYTLYAVKGNVDLNRYELPPLPPEGMFDIRYSSGRVAEDINTSAKGIDMTGITYPVKVKVENMDIKLQDETGREINTDIKAGEEITVSNPAVKKLMVSGQLIPDKYSLEQNYPNPFNPSTTIKFALPEAAEVTLTIYNTLGQKVAELVNSKLEAGNYSYEWNGRNAATGMYIYELRTEKFVSIKKMMLLK